MIKWIILQNEILAQVSADATQLSVSENTKTLNFGYNFHLFFFSYFQRARVISQLMLLGSLVEKHPPSMLCSKNPPLTATVEFVTD